MSRACPLCSASSPLPIKAMSYALPEGSTLPEKTIISQCSRCGFLYADSNASAQAYQAHYESDSIYAASDIRPGDGSSQNDKSRLTQAAERLVAHMPPDSLMIDIGAATGGMLAAVSSLTTVPLLGLDPDPMCVETMRGHGYAAEVATLSSLPKRLNGTAGAISLSHVLEHLWEPARGLASAMALLNENGIAYIETPNAARYHEHPNALNYYFDPEHINHFTLPDFENLALGAGAQVIESGETNIFLEDGSSYPAAWAVLGKRKKEKAKDISLRRLSVGHHPALNYIASQTAIELEANESLQLALNGSPSVLIWGTGSHAQRSLVSLGTAVDQIVAFIDSDPAKQKKILLGRPILSPDDAFRTFPNLPVMILAASSADQAIRSVLFSRWPSRKIIEFPRD